MKRFIKYGAFAALLIASFCAGVFYTAHDVTSTLVPRISGGVMLDLARLDIERAREFRTAPSTFLESVELSAASRIANYVSNFEHIRELDDEAAEVRAIAIAYASDFGIDLLDYNPEGSK